MNQHWHHYNHTSILSLKVSVLCWSPQSFWIDFCVWYKLRDQFCSSACGYPVSPTPFVEEDICYSLCRLGMFVEDDLTICVWVDLWALYSVLLMYMSVYMPVSYYFDNCSFLICFEVRKYDTFKICSSFSCYFDNSGSFSEPYKF